MGRKTKLKKKLLRKRKIHNPFLKKKNQFQKKRIHNLFLRRRINQFLKKRKMIFPPVLSANLLELSASQASLKKKRINQFLRRRINQFLKKKMIFPPVLSANLLELLASLPKLHLFLPLKHPAAHSHAHHPHLHHPAALAAQVAAVMILNQLMGLTLPPMILHLGFHPDSPISATDGEEEDGINGEIYAPAATHAQKHH